MIRLHLIGGGMSVDCDAPGCEETHFVPTQQIELWREDARHAGWTCDGIADRCPGHDGSAVVDKRVIRKLRDVIGFVSGWVCQREVGGPEVTKVLNALEEICALLAQQEPRLAATSTAEPLADPASMPPGEQMIWAAVFGAAMVDPKCHPHEAAVRARRAVMVAREMANDDEVGADVRSLIGGGP